MTHRHPQPIGRTARPRSTRAFTIVEILVVITVIALLGLMVLPAIPEMIRSQKHAATKNLIQSALRLAQAHAIKTQNHAGVRFQFDKDGPLAGRQYMVIIEYSGQSSIYHAVPNIDPIAIPRGIGVMNDVAAWADLTDPVKAENRLYRAATFSVVFSQKGQVVRKNIRVGYTGVDDTIFGGFDEVNNADPLDPQAPFLYHDLTWGPEEGPDWGDLIYGKETTIELCLYDVGQMAEVGAEHRYSDYIGVSTDGSVEWWYINIYTGEMMDDRDFEELGS